ncbi:uncharacterized protein LOC127709712 [Mytilus californianus]|uniref:uncharacterized protein LOC127709712 n=1 Tax=Mytilus californianus TaxID=6549 RepID=UPI0022469271|nr:uncharacterized protein LOC127709712 [Mytilus californianus]
MKGFAVFCSLAFLVFVWSTSCAAEGNASESTLDSVLPENLKDHTFNVLQFEPRPVTGTCRCVNASCGCCQTLSIAKLHIKKEVCINVKYLKKEIGFLLTVTLDGKPILKKEVSVQNPPPICLKVPLVKKLKKLASICIEFSEVHVGKDGLSGCSELTVHFVFIKVVKLKLGCFKIPFSEYELNMIHQQGVEYLLPGIVQPDGSKTENRDFPNSIFLQNNDEWNKKLYKRKSDFNILPKDQPAEKIPIGDEISFGDEIVATEDGCHCTGETCNCCKTVSLKFLSLTKQVCVNLVFDQQGLGFELQLSIDGKVILHQKVEARNPSPVCINIPLHGMEVKACIEFTNLKVSSSGMSGCLDLSAKIKREYKFQLGCFKIPPSDHSLSDLLSESGVIVTTGDGCTCSANGCNCCKTVTMKGITKTVCINLIYKGLEIDVKLQVDGKVYFTKEFEVKSPPPNMCTTINIKGTSVKVCVQLTEFKVESKDVSGCVGASASAFGQHYNIKLGCFKMSPAQYRIFKSSYIFESEIDYAK